MTRGEGSFIHREMQEQGGRKNSDSLGEGGFAGVGELWGIHSLLPLIYSCTCTPTEAGVFLRGRCSSCTVAHVLWLHLRCG